MPQSMNQYLLRDGSRVHLLTDPEDHDVFSYEGVSGQCVHVALSAKAEKALIRTVDFNKSVLRPKADLAMA